MKKIIPLIAVSLMTASLFAVAQSQINPSGDRHAERQAKAQARFQALDVNRDAKLSYAEMQNNAEHRERFNKADLNHDGGLSQDEMKQAHQQKKQQHEQRRNQGREKMQSLDLDKDQALTRAEIGSGMPKLLENFSIIDGNNDGKITREEMQIARKAMRAERQSQAK
jgi:Ca2+-binding EF-hand superfamily protein